jgi:hypothetical protein
MSDYIGGKSQKEEILELLRSRKGQWVPLPELLSIAAQYGARVMELRRAGFDIANKTERVGRMTHSWFMLVSEPDSVKRTTKKPIQEGWEFGSGSAVAL